MLYSTTMCSMGTSMISATAIEIFPEMRFTVSSSTFLTMIWGRYILPFEKQISYFSSRSLLSSAIKVLMSLN